MSIMGHLGLTALFFIILLQLLGKDTRSRDYRVLALAALLPDLIDKPLALMSLGPGRGYAHTLLFLIVIWLIARRIGRIELAFGVLMHLSLDFMMLEPRIFFWPVAGLRMEFSRHVISYYWEMIFTSSFMFYSEMIGTLLLLALFVLYRLYRHENLMLFIKSGRMAGA